MASDARRLVESVLTGHMTSQVWTSAYTPVFPFVPQQFAVGALLPMVLYLFRWGHRRGRGRFATVFRSEGGAPTIHSVVEKLSEQATTSGVDTTIAKTILGDMLLTAALENKLRREGHSEQVQRCFPNHYLSSWIDLPAATANLRGVPEMITALMSGQSDGDKIEPFANNGRYRVGARVQDHELLRAFGPGVVTVGVPSDLRSDKFDETFPLALDQLVMVRLALLCGEAPSKATGKGEPGPIPNQRPIAIKAAKDFQEDLLVFFDCYGRRNVTPRAALLAMLESAFSVGLTSIILSTVSIMMRWSDSGTIDNDRSESGFPIFIDCSNSTDLELRDYSEQSNGLVRQAMGRLPAILMYARLLDFYVRNESDIPRTSLPSTSPDATNWLKLLGNLLNGSHDEARDAEKFFRSKSRALIDAAEADPSTDFKIDALASENDSGMYGRRLAEALSSAFEQSGGGDKLSATFSSALMVDENNGLSRRRKVSFRQTPAGQRRTADAISFVLTNTVVEYMVHRHLRSSGKGRRERSLSYPEFLDILRSRHGFFVDQCPPNMQIPTKFYREIDAFWNGVSEISDFLRVSTTPSV